MTSYYETLENSRLQKIQISRHNSTSHKDEDQTELMKAENTPVLQ